MARDGYESDGSKLLSIELGHSRTYKMKKHGSPTMMGWFLVIDPLMSKSVSNEANRKKKIIASRWIV